MIILKTLFDTSVYGRIVQEKKDVVLKERIDERRDVVVYGNKVISDELQETPERIPDSTGEKLKLKQRLLELYLFLVKDHDLEITGLIFYLAKQYLESCKAIHKISKDKLQNDFLIVACASFHGLDIVVSEDNRTMRSGEALRAYQKINQQEKLRTPKFISLQEFEKILKM